MTERGRWLIVGLGVIVGCGGRSDLQSGLQGTAAVGGSAAGVGVNGAAGGAAPNGGNSAIGGSFGSVSGSSGDASSGGATGGVGASAGTIGSGGVGGAGALRGWYVDPLRGDDRSSGDYGAPFKTLERAAEVASESETVWLFDGTYDESTERRFAPAPGQDCSTGSGVTFAAGVRLRAVNPRQPRLLVAGNHGLCLSGGAVQGLHLECEAPNGRAIEVTAGVEEIVDSSFTGCGSTSTAGFRANDAGLDVSGDAQVRLFPGTLPDYSGDPNYTFAAVRERATLSVEGGAVRALHRAFVVSDASTLELNGVDVLGQAPSQRASQAIQVLEGGPAVMLSGSTIAGYEAGVRVESADGRLVIDESRFTDLAFGVLAERPTPDSALRVRITRSRFEAIDIGLSVAQIDGSADFSIWSSDFKGVHRPMVLRLGGRFMLHDVRISDCDHAPYVGSFAGATPLYALFRRVSVTGCQNGGLRLVGVDSTVFDLGTSASPGGNVLRDNRRAGLAGSSNLYFGSSAPLLISAIGNSWDPNEQGTDAEGHCFVTDGAQTWDLTSASGPNFTTTDGNQAVLRLAEVVP